MPRITHCLWFDSEGKEAADFYCSVFPNSKINNVLIAGDAGPGEPGSVVTVEFELDGQEYTALNGGPQFTFNEAVSVVINCADQAEVDQYWNALTAGGGEEGHCGWLKDKFGLSWQVVPDELGALLTDPDPDRAGRAMKAMLSSMKLDVNEIRAAADGKK